MLKKLRVFNSYKIDKLRLANSTTMSDACVTSTTQRTLKIVCCDSKFFDKTYFIFLSYLKRRIVIVESFDFGVKKNNASVTYIGPLISQLRHWMWTRNEFFFFFILQIKKNASGNKHCSRFKCVRRRWLCVLHSTRLLRATG